MLWRVGTIIKKVSKKRAIVADRVSGGKLRDVDPRPLEGIPPTDWGFDTKDEADWSWEAPRGDKGDDRPHIEEEDVKKVAMWTIKTCVDEGMTANQAAEYVPYSNTTVYNWLNDYEEGDREKREWVETVNRVIA